MDAKVPRLIYLVQCGRLPRSLELSRNHMTVGRQPVDDLFLADPSVSRRHAVISIDNNGCVRVHDLGSTNGTTVNGRSVTTSTALQPGDVVAFGGVRYEFDGTNEQPQIQILLSKPLSDLLAPAATCLGAGNYSLQSPLLGATSSPSTRSTASPAHRQDPPQLERRP